ncbi:hypothetical protein KPNIH19_14586 [Klebsiella pneumoniae subsp. pneumoniae KPNIH19]|nr:hypothetical protein KPNIH19_14586 [Klebsiella pneumoniae subsp. pneumoniae KPNIH19]KSW30448.1 hypothetical protein APT65_22395 [Klebsiella pneumoniae]
MHGNSLGDRFPIALHLWYLTFALLCLKAPAIAIGEAESIHKINILQRFQPREKNGIRCAENTKHKDFSPAAEVHCAATSVLYTR